MNEDDFTKRIDKIVSYKTWSNEKKIDRLLFINADMYCNLGTDSTKSDRHQAEIYSRYIYRAIKKIDIYLGTFLLTTDEQ